tara:strand:- start:60 stop:212 length:153 start_codon:yes stop_codon:yes gene_type:complete
LAKRQNWKFGKTKTKKLQKFKDAKINQNFDKKNVSRAKIELPKPKPSPKS